MPSEQFEAGFGRCLGCSELVDFTTCYCGDAINGCGSMHDNHAPVPMGCKCHIWEEPTDADR